MIYCGSEEGQEEEIELPQVRNYYERELKVPGIVTSYIMNLQSHRTLSPPYTNPLKGHYQLYRPSKLDNTP